MKEHKIDVVHSKRGYVARCRAYPSSMKISGIAGKRLVPQLADALMYWIAAHEGADRTAPCEN